MSVPELPSLTGLMPGGEPAFGQTSRYSGLPIASVTLPDGSDAAYVTRRLIPPPTAFSIAGTAQVEVGDRPDLVAARAYGRPEFDWRLADAAGASDPETLTAAPGTRLAVPLPGPTHQADGDA
ncbi:hypothetical protein SAMN05518801_101342 [Novosphingobium sp. CF614]|uniref:hypothetical protein n=1 Tax=Novosphingobium sp. CF614 TaxID=1884364 RepID=UPI0008F116D8|nr:hypothetical protein [Novosphingobium sp. CF614]SFF76433.1 hypothetical protein SAMN05518801_101342 [Novosphingobium sp. CF614]